MILSRLKSLLQLPFLKSQDSCNSKVVEHLEKLKVLFSHNFEIIYSDVAIYNELLQVVKDLQDFKMYLSGVNLGIFTHDTIFQMLRSLIDEKKAAEKRCEELLKDKQDFDIKIEHLEKELQLAKEGREKTMTDFKEILNLRDGALSKYFDESPKGIQILKKLNSHEENNRIAVGKKSNPALRHGKPGSGVGHFQVDYAINEFKQRTLYFGLSNLAS
ncbi:hypothetical protein MTR_2g087620 [Medicago truncatula]|uniref:Uncharacterized protein n=1 Tax=Medicago truncatula TaxID=3880 RepID=G7IRG1_MEDTR|nr:hypothetical protein MTR_2g087620 [Medicago truncatula]